MNSADLFAGLGGFTEGAEQSGLPVKLCANHWGEAVKWHALNHPKVAHYCQDLMHFDWRLLPDLREGLLLASPACQGFSEAGQPAASRYGHNGGLRQHQADRNTAWAVIAALDSARPMGAVIENVLPFQRWPLFEAWLGNVKAMGYHVVVHELNALDFGSAQHRVRTVITAHLRGPVRIERTGTAQGSRTCLDLDADHGKRWNTIDSRSERMRWRMKKAQDRAGSHCLWNNVSEGKGRTLDEPMPTLTTKSGSQLYLLDGDRCRILNPRELARGQGFPEHYQIPESRGLASKLIGNAIDVNVSRAVVEQMSA